MAYFQVDMGLDWIFSSPLGKCKRRGKVVYRYCCEETESTGQVCLENISTDVHVAEKKQLVVLRTSKSR